MNGKERFRSFRQDCARSWEILGKVWLRGVDLFPSESLSLRNLLIPREAGMPK